MSSASTMSAGRSPQTSMCRRNMGCLSYAKATSARAMATMSGASLRDRVATSGAPTTRPLAGQALGLRVRKELDALQQRQLDRLGQAADGWRLEQRADADVDAEPPAQASHHLHGEQGVTTEREEVIVE